MKKIIVFFVAFLSLNVLAQQNQEDVSLWRGEPFGTHEMSKEIIEKRDAFSKHFDQGDGNVTAHIASGPIHYQENGEWKTIYHTISPSANGFENIHNSFKTYYPATATGEIKTILPNGGTISDMISMKMYFEANGQKINVQSIKNAPGQASFNELTYTNAYGNGIDLRLTQNTTKRKMDYIIHSLDALGNIPSNVNNLVFEESVALPTGWKAVLENNEILLIDERGAVQAKYEKPIFEDAPFTDKTERNNEKAVSAENTDKETISELSNRETIQNVNGSLRSKVGQYEIVQNGNILTIKTLVEVNWLTSEDRVFPLTIDPTMDFYPTATSHTGHTDGGYYNCGSGWIGTGAVSGYWLLGWSKFVTTSMPSCANINSTTINFNIYYNNYCNCEGQSISFKKMNDRDSYPNNCATLWNAVNGGSQYALTGLMGAPPRTGWKSQVLGTTANSDVGNGTGQITVGFDPSGSFYNGEWLEIHGQDHAYKPYLTVNYTIIPNTLTVDAGPDKEICIGESVVLNGEVSYPTPPVLPSYCGILNPSYNDATGITRVRFSNIDNTSSGDPIYTDFSSNPAVVTAGSSHTLTVNINTQGYACGTRAYIDWNRNGNFEDAGEIYDLGVNSSGNNVQTQYSPVISIPGNAYGDYKMRIRTAYNYSPNSCSAYNYSEAEDYTINILPLPATYSWSGGPIVSGGNTPTPIVNPTTTTTYTYTVTKADGCTGTDQVTVNVSPSSTPPTASTGGGNYCHGNNITLTQSGGTDGTGAVNVWYAASGETVPSSSSCDNEGFMELWNQFEYNDPNCYYNHHSTDYNVNNGILEVDVTGPDPFIWMYPLPGNVTIDADEYKYINVRYRVTNYVNNGVSHQPRMGVLFTKREHCDPYGYPTGYYPFSDSQYEPGSERKEINADGQWHIVSIPINNSANWHGTITGLRLDYFDPYPHEGNIGSSMEIDFLIVSKHPMIGEGKSITLSPGDEYYPTETTTYYAKKIDNCGTTSCVNETVVLPPAGTSLANHNESATCTVNNGERVHFYHSSSGRLITTVEATGGNLGSVTATAYVDAGAQTVQACDFNNYETTVMQRHWMITPTNQSPASVYLPFTDAEYNDLVATANANQNPDDDLFSLADLKLSKYRGPNNINSNYEDNCKTMGGDHDPNQPTALQATTLHDINGNGSITIADGYVEPISGAQFVQFNIPSFSEFWLHGQSANSPLPVTLTSFSASCKENVMLSWTTASEQNSDRFVVEKSRDGVTWEFVGEQTAAGNSNAIKNYSQTDHTTWNGVSYYRLRQIDFDGKEEIYGPINVFCDGKGNNITVYPNPNDGDFIVEITTDKAISDAELQLFDITGKIISAQHLQIPEGITQVSIDKKAYLKPGTYVLKVIADVYFEPVKIVVK